MNFLYGNSFYNNCLIYLLFNTLRFVSNNCFCLSRNHYYPFYIICVNKKKERRTIKKRELFLRLRFFFQYKLVSFVINFKFKNKVFLIFIYSVLFWRNNSHANFNKINKIQKTKKNSIIFPLTCKKPPK